LSSFHESRAERAALRLSPVSSADRSAVNQSHVDHSAIDPIALYASGIDTSDYTARVAPLIRRGVPAIGDLLDVGAGGGQLGLALRDPQRRWTAIEPSANMRARLTRLPAGPHLVPCGWAEARIADADHDTVLAANISAPVQEPREFLARCRAWARRAVVWVVPAQEGPRGLILAGCLPARWHGEDETPGVDLVLDALPPSEQPDAVATVAWTFSFVTPDLATIAAYLASRLGWPESGEMLAHLAAQAKSDARGARLDVARKSAVLVWGRP
jgi:hypothetical protein